MAKTSRQKSQKESQAGGEGNGDRKSQKVNQQSPDDTVFNQKVVEFDTNSNMNNGETDDAGKDDTNLNPQSAITNTETLNSWLNVIIGGNNKKAATPIQPLTETNMVTIDEDDVIGGINYWSSAVVCYVFGENPLFFVTNGFCNRIWGKHGSDKVIMVGRGLFLVRFNSVEHYDRVIAGDPQFFDYKPAIIK
ncbi:Peroxisomal biogenesis factor 6 [Bienertia sinuspersici]